MNENFMKFNSERTNEQLSLVKNPVFCGVLF